MSAPRAYRALDQFAETARTLPLDRRPINWRTLFDAAPSRPANLATLLDDVAAEFLQRPTGSAARVPDTGQCRKRNCGEVACS